MSTEKATFRPYDPSHLETLQVMDFIDLPTLRDQIFQQGLSQYILLNLTGRPVRLLENAVSRMIAVASDCEASISYSYFIEEQEDGSVRRHPLNEYQYGSVRDNFDFGPLVLLNVADTMMALDIIGTDDFSREENPDGGWYALRLRLGVLRPVCCINEYLYVARRVEYRDSGERQHDYVDPSQASYQAAMEKIFSVFVHEVDWAIPEEEIRKIDFAPLQDSFPVKASVIIPVRNRVRTVGDAVRSALDQKTTFPFNVIVVDNDSSDGTSELLDSINDPRLTVIHVKADEGLGIGGCWNRAIQSADCGEFAVQLDSDDLYSSDNTLQRIVDCFYEKECGMVVGSYTLTDFDLRPIGKGVIDHREWTDENGHNNALRINGFGAPRAFYTPIVREILFPNVSYGEDYAMALRISRQYKVGRIFDSIYTCRRWEGNSDAGLSLEKEIEHNNYKDFIRSLEISSRLHENRERWSEKVEEMKRSGKFPPFPNLEDMDFDVEDDNDEEDDDED